MKKWNKRYFRREGTAIRYTSKESDPPEKVRATQVGQQCPVFHSFTVVLVCMMCTCAARVFVCMYVCVCVWQGKLIELEGASFEEMGYGDIDSNGVEVQDHHLTLP